MSPLDALVPRAQEGDRAALEELVRGLQDPLYRLALRFLGRREEARDATQEILILVITKLSTFRAESSIKTWAYRVASRHLLRSKSEEQFHFDQLASDLGKPPNEIAPSVLAHADARLLEEEVFLGCTQAMLRALDRDQRIAFILGAICEVEAKEAAYALSISEAAFRKRLSRARHALDEFVQEHCSVANAHNRCRCAHQVNHRIHKGTLVPGQPRFTLHDPQTTLEALRAQREIGKVKRALELYRAQPVDRSPQDFAAHLHKLLAGTDLLVFDA
ncbi:MAG TPA: RNA polymerase sigma factor [Polyangiales bacterium]